MAISLGIYPIFRQTHMQIRHWKGFEPPTHGMSNNMVSTCCSLSSSTSTCTDCNAKSESKEACELWTQKHHLASARNMLIPSWAWETNCFRIESAQGHAKKNKILLCTSNSSRTTSKKILRHLEEFQSTKAQDWLTRILWLLCHPVTTRDGEHHRLRCQEKFQGTGDASCSKPENSWSSTCHWHGNGLRMRWIRLSTFGKELSQAQHLGLFNWSEGKKLNGPYWIRSQGQPLTMLKSTCCTTCAARNSEPSTTFPDHILLLSVNVHHCFQIWQTSLKCSQVQSH